MTDAEPGQVVTGMVSPDRLGEVTRRRARLRGDESADTVAVTGRCGCRQLAMTNIITAGGQRRMAEDASMVTTRGGVD